MGKGRSKHQGNTVSSATVATTGEQILGALYGQWASSPLFEIVQEAAIVRPIVKGLQAMREQQPGLVPGIERQIESFCRRLGNLALREGAGVFARLAQVERFWEEQEGRPIDPVRLLLLVSHGRLAADLERDPTVEELRAAAIAARPGLEAMEDSQFRRTCRGLKLTFTNARDLSTLRNFHRRCVTRNGDRPPKHREFWRLAREKGLLFSDLPLLDFSLRCLRDGLGFADLAESPRE